MEQWKVLKLDCLPAYITWDRYLANQERVASASLAARAPRGAPRRRRAARPACVVCGNCGRRLQTSYRTPRHAYYSCVRHLHEGTEQVCFGLKAAVSTTW